METALWDQPSLLLSHSLSRSLNNRRESDPSQLLTSGLWERRVRRSMHYADTGSAVLPGPGILEGFPAEVLPGELGAGWGGQVEREAALQTWWEAEAVTGACGEAGGGGPASLGAEASAACS